MSSDSDKQILRERAKALARATARPIAQEAGVEMLEFLLAGERYGIETAWLREVCPLRDLTPLPTTPAFVLGIINRRGQVVSVVDLRKILELPGEGLSGLSQVLILQRKQMEFGIAVDEIIGPRFSPTNAFQTSLPTLTGVRERYLKGITRDGLVLLDAGRVLADKGLVVNETAEIQMTANL